MRDVAICNLKTILNLNLSAVPSSTVWVVLCYAMLCYAMFLHPHFCHFVDSVLLFCVRSETVFVCHCWQQTERNSTHSAHIIFAFAVLAYLYCICFQISCCFCLYLYCIFCHCWQQTGRNSTHSADIIFAFAALA